MLSMLRSLIAPAAPTPAPPAPAQVRNPPPCYPPATPEFIATPPADLIAGLRPKVQELVDRLPLERETFDAMILPALVRFAGWVHLLPASASHHHALPGGLLYHSIEVAAIAALRFGGDRPLLDPESPSRQRHREERWTIACAMAGLLHDIGKPLVDIKASLPSGDVWPSHVMPLWDWLERSQAPSYSIAWREGQRLGRHEQFATTVMRDILGPDLLGYLSEYGAQDCIIALIQTLAGTAASGNLIAPKVMQADSDSTQRDRKRVREHLLAAGQGQELGLAQQAIAVIAERARSGEWPVNATGGLLFSSGGQLWAKYPDTLVSVAGALRDQELEYVPNDPSELLQQLIDTDLVPKAAHGVCRRMAFAMPGAASEISITVFPFASPEIVLGRQPLPETDLGVIRDATPAGAPPPAPAPLPTPPEPAASPPADSPPAAAAQATPATPPLVVDRRDRRDLSEERSIERMPTDTGASADELLEMLDKAGIEGQSLRTVIRRFIEGTLRWGVDVFEKGEHTLLRWPSAVAGLGVPTTDLLGLAHKRGWVVAGVDAASKVADATFPVRGAAKAIVLTGLPANVFERLRDEQPALFTLPATEPETAPELRSAPARTATDTPRIDASALTVRSSADVNPAIAEGIKGEVFRLLLQAARCSGLKDPVQLSEAEVRTVLDQYITQSGSRPLPVGAACFKGANPLLESDDPAQIHPKKVGRIRVSRDYQPPTWANA